MWFDILKEDDLYNQRVMEITKKSLEAIFTRVILEENTSYAYKLAPEVQENYYSFYIGAEKTYNESSFVLNLRFLYDMDESKFIYCNVFINQSDGSWERIKLENKYDLTDLINVVKEFDRWIKRHGRYPLINTSDFDKIFWKGYDVV